MKVKWIDSPLTEFTLRHPSLSLSKQLGSLATSVPLSANRRLLNVNPIGGIPLNSEKNPLRPVTSWDRFEKTCEAIKSLRHEAKSEGIARRWFKVGLALVVAEATGRRLSSIRQLRWEDIDFKTAEVIWRADTDKKGKAWKVRMAQRLLDALRAGRQELSAISGYVFASEEDSREPMSRAELGWWLRKAEERAALPKLKGGLWHPYRRMWATVRKHLPAKDTAAVGGWSDVATMQRCYVSEDPETLQMVVDEPAKLRDRVEAGETAQAGGYR